MRNYEYTLDSLEEIIEKYKDINSFYRSGNLEIFVKEQGYGYLKDEEKIFSFDESQNSKESTLQYVADKLFWEVKNDFWDKDKIPKDYFSEIDRILTISFEIDEILLMFPRKKENSSITFGRFFLTLRTTKLHILLLKKKLIITQKDSRVGKKLLTLTLLTNLF